MRRWVVALALLVMFFIGVTLGTTACRLHSASANQKQEKPSEPKHPDKPGEKPGPPDKPAPGPQREPGDGDVRPTPTPTPRIKGQ